jgi:DNA-binding PadR family transcriptional regulator
MLQATPDVTQREIAERLGVSTSGLNYCLNALIDKGWVKVQNLSQSKNKFGNIYALTPQGKGNGQNTLSLSTRIYCRGLRLPQKGVPAFASRAQHVETPSTSGLVWETGSDRVLAWTFF